MGLFSFLKKKKKEKPEEETKKRLDFSEIENWVNKNIKKNNEKEKQVLENLDRKTKEFIPNLKEKLEALKNFDVDSCKSDERAKSIVKQGRRDYLEKAERLISDIDNFEKKDIETYITKINEAFTGFHKKTNISFQKANYLIGKELSEIKNTLREFSKEIMNIFNENKNLIEETKKLESIKQGLQRINEYEKEINITSEDLKKVKNKIKEEKDEKQKVLDKIKEIKESEEYKKNLERKEKVSSMKKELDFHIKKLKEIIDFKELSNFMHTFPERIKIVKEYKENFLEKFKENKEKIINLIGEANLKNSEIDNKLKEIQEKEKSLEEQKNQIQEDKTEKHYDKIEKMDSEIETLEQRKISKEKRENRLETEKSDLKNSIKSKVEELDVEIV